MADTQRVNTPEDQESNQEAKVQGNKAESSNVSDIGSNVGNLRSKVGDKVKSTLNDFDEKKIPEYVDTGMTLAEKYGLQQKLNKTALYLDDPENTKTQKIMTRIRKYWDKLPGVIQAEIVHNLTQNDPIHMTLRFMAKTGLLEYKRAGKAEDTKTISAGTRNVLKWLFKIAKLFVDDLKGIDDEIVDGIMKGAGFADDMLFSAKLEVESARRGREAKVIPIKKATTKTTKKAA